VFNIDNFRLLPLTPRQLADGILVGSLLSPALLVSAVLVGITLSGFSVTTGAMALMVAAALVLLALCVVAGRFVGLGVGVLARHRRSRDLLIVISVPVSLVPLFLLFEISHTLRDPAAGSPIAGTVGWLPLGWPGRSMAAAAQGRPGEAVTFLAASVILLGLGWLAVTRLTRTALMGEDRSHAPVHGVAEPFDQFATRLPATRRGAVAAASWRGLVRDSARIPELLIGTLVLGGMFTAIGVAIVAQTNEPLAVIGAIGIAYIPMSRRLNEFGLAGPAYWMDVVAPGSSRDDLLGRDLAAVLIDGPLCLVVTTAVAVGTRGLAWLPVGIAFVAASVALSYTVTRVSSVLFASRQSVAKDSTSRTASGRDPRRIGVQLGAMLGLALALAPIVAAIVLLVQGDTAWAAPAAVGVLAYGAVVYLVGLTLVARWLAGHEPELLAKVGG
jgi:ABC-2 type transport system permease protein